MSTLRILIADDNDIVLRSLRSLLEPDFDVVGTVGDGAELLEVVDELDADVIVLDISMPRIEGIEAARLLRERGTPAAIVFLTVHRLESIVEAALATGACGYVLKSRAADDLIPAIEAAAEGRRYVSAPLVDTPTP